MNEKEFLARIGQKIKKLRKEQSIRQYALARKCNFEKASLSRIESGKTNTSAVTLWRISKALKVPIAILFED